MLQELKLEGLPPGCRVEFGSCGEEQWDRLALQFDDLVLYQTWQYGAMRWGERNLAHVLVTRDGQAVGAAQASLARLPLLGAGVAYVAWAPLCRPKGGPQCPEAYRLVLRGLRSGCARREGLCLRLRPQDRSAGCDPAWQILAEEGFDYRQSGGGYATVEMDISLPPDQLYQNLQGSWRRQLKRGEASGLEVCDGTDLLLYDELLRLYGEMKDRKQFVSFADPHQFRAIQERLPEALRMRTIVCRSGSEPVSALVYSPLGDTVVGIFAASSAAGRELRASYVMWWRVLELLHERGFRRLDLGGLDLARAPGPARFKLGLAGKSGGVVRHIGQFEAPGSVLSRLCLCAGSSFQKSYRRARMAVSEVRRPRGSTAVGGSGPREEEETANERSE